MKKTILCILDGVGLRDEIYGNAVKQANTPIFDSLFKYPNSKLEASGELVGLPKGQMGNSEVGHTNIGAGKIVYQPLELINNKIKNNELDNKLYHEIFKKDKIHIMGLISDGGVHSHINHLIEIIKLCKKYNKKAYLHLFTDGRDTLPNKALDYFDTLNEYLDDDIKIATIQGRFYAMDRDNRIDRIKKASDCIFNGIGKHYSNYKECILDNYKNDINDEFILPSILDKNGMIEENNGIIIFNFRPDRLREIGLEINKIKNTQLVTMMPITKEVNHKSVFNLDNIDNPLGKIISDNNLSQLRIAETEKYAHVTYFFDGGRELDLKNKDQILIPSPQVRTYDLMPEMSAYLITDKLIEVMNNYDFIVVNYANGDMVGHTGNLEKAIEAMEHLDKCLEKLINETQKNNYTLIITADHGNLEYMLDGNNIITSHTTNKVPFIILDNKYELKDGKLADIAPTILYLMDIEIPKDMNGNILIKGVKNEGSKI